jgi:hypothetical protein
VYSSIISIWGCNQSKNESLYLIMGPTTCQAMRMHHLSILKSCGADKPRSTCNLSNGTLSRKKDTKSDLYLNFFKFPLPYFINCLFILQRTASDQLMLVVEPDYLPNLEVFYFQPCLYPMKYLHPRSMYTLPREGV